jgi:hypothetical protein
VIDEKKVIVFTPWGRELTASLLFKYLERDYKAGVVDEWHLWMNTDPDQLWDRNYGYKLAEENDWIKCVELGDEPRLHPKQLNTGRFYVFYQDLKDAVMVRMDDDIVWVEPNAIERLVQYRIQNEFPFVAFPLIWNNAVCSYYLQQTGGMPKDWGEVQTNHCMDPLGWADHHFAVNIHNYLLDKIEKNEVDDIFMHTSVMLPLGHQFSVSCFAQFPVVYSTGVQGEEEAWHTINLPYQLQRPNVIVPNALVSHFTFYPQRDYILGNTDLLDRYKELAENV